MRCRRRSSEATGGLRRRCSRGCARGFGSSRIVERHRLRADSAWPGGSRRWAWCGRPGARWTARSRSPGSAGSGCCGRVVAGDDILDDRQPVRCHSPDPPCPVRASSGPASRCPTASSPTTTSPELMDTSDEWIRTRTGIQERRWAREGETSAGLAHAASLRALEAAGLDAGDARRHRLRHLDARSLRPRQRRLPPATARRRHHPLDRHPEPVQRIRLRARDGGRVHPVRAVPPRAGGGRGDPVHGAWT